MLEGSNIVLAQIVAVHHDDFGTFVLQKDPIVIPDNLALALGYRIQPLSAANAFDGPEGSQGPMSSLVCLRLQQSNLGNYPESLNLFCDLY